MARLKKRCPVCGATVDLDPAMVAFVTRDAKDEVGGAYAFGCPGCATPVVVVADGTTVDLLRIAGVHEIREPAVPGHPETPPVGPTLTLDDLIDLHLALEQVDLLAEVAGSPGG